MYRVLFRTLPWGIEFHPAPPKVLNNRLVADGGNRELPDLLEFHPAQECGNGLLDGQAVVEKELKCPGPCRPNRPSLLEESPFLGAWTQPEGQFLQIGATHQPIAQRTTPRPLLRALPPPSIQSSQPHSSLTSRPMTIPAKRPVVNLTLFRHLFRLTNSGIRSKIPELMNNLLVILLFAGG